MAASVADILDSIVDAIQPVMRTENDVRKLRKSIAAVREDERAAAADAPEDGAPDGE